MFSVFKQRQSCQMLSGWTANTHDSRTDISFFACVLHLVILGMQIAFLLFL